MSMIQELWIRMCRPKDCVVEKGIQSKAAAFRSELQLFGTSDEPCNYINIQPHPSNMLPLSQNKKSLTRKY